MQTPFDSAICGVCETIRRIIISLPESIKNNTQEIRIRSNLPLCLTVGGKPVFVTKEGQTSVFPKNSYICSKEETDECFMLITNHSVYAHTAEIKNGFIRMNGGHRAGICGTVSEDGMIYDISGINIRIARQIKGCADEIFEKCKNGTLILGAAGSGKTTMLRDLIRLNSLSGKRVSVIDSRGEISASCGGVSNYDLGPNTDVYITENKALGIESALRTMFPNIIAFDEIGNISELNSVKNGFNAGTDIITTAHIGKIEDVAYREVTENLVLSGAIDIIVMMPRVIGGELKIYKREEIINAYFT